MTKALARHERREARVIPVILRPCRWTSTPLAKLQAVPKDARPVSEWSSRDAAFDDIATAIERTVKELREERRRAAEQARQRAEAARLAAEQRRRADAEEESRRRQLEAARKAEEERKRLEAEAKRKAEEEASKLQREKGTGAGMTSALAWLRLRWKPLALIGSIGGSCSCCSFLFASVTSQNPLQFRPPHLSQSRRRPPHLPRLHRSKWCPSRNLSSRSPSRP